MQASAYLTLTALSILFVTWPNPDQSLIALDYFNISLKDIESGRLKRAEENLTIASRYVSENPEFNFAFGNLWLKKGDRTRAKYFFRHTLELDPRHSSAYNNLGILAMEEKRWPLAEKFLTAALRFEPDDAKTLYLLANVKFEMGDLKAALKNAESAYNLNPGPHEFRGLIDKINAAGEGSH